MTDARVPHQPDQLDLPDLVRHVSSTTGLPAPAAARVVADVLAYLDEDVEAYVRRRHAELQRRGLTNTAIWLRLAAETGTRRFAAPVLSERQLRRIVYG